MSAFILSHKHINAILSWANAQPNILLHRRSDKARIDPAQIADLQMSAEILQTQNLLSVDYRYKETNQEPVISFQFTDQPLKPIEVIKACACYDYQSCETGDYAETDAAGIIDQIRNHAITQLTGYKEAAWEIR